MNSHRLWWLLVVCLGPIVHSQQDWWSVMPSLAAFRKRRSGSAVHHDNAASAVLIWLLGWKLRGLLSSHQPQDQFQSRFRRYLIVADYRVILIDGLSKALLSLAPSKRGSWHGCDVVLVYRPLRSAQPYDGAPPRRGKSVHWGILECHCP